MFHLSQTQPYYSHYIAFTAAKGLTLFP